MRFIYVVSRTDLFPGLSPQGFLPLSAIDIASVEKRAFFAERDHMEQCSHFKQIIPYLALQLGDKILCYQRRSKHTEQRLGGLWTIGFGGHIEPIDRDAPGVEKDGLLNTSALREVHEETGLELDASHLKATGYINSEANEVSTVHFGIFYRVQLDSLGKSHDEIAALVEAQAEPHQVAWRTLSELKNTDGSVGPAPENGEWEDWTNIALQGIDS